MDISLDHSISKGENDGHSYHLRSWHTPSSGCHIQRSSFSDELETAAKANGQYRLLLVDGHNSHYTHGFLEYARTHQILVACYPAHTTHVLQGLNVAVFATVKHVLSEERNKFEQETGQEINKKNFLAIYGAAHRRALTEETIKSAF